MRVLLSIGCNVYDHLETLSGAERDADRVFRLLTGPAGEYDPKSSILLLSPTLGEFRESVGSTLFNTRRIDVLTIFFAGHGGVKTGTYYLCLRDSAPQRLSASALPVANLFSMISEVGPKQANIVLDACESAGAMHNIAALLKPDLIGPSGSLSIAFLAACASNQFAGESPESGIATSALISYVVGDKRVQDVRPYLDLVEIGRALSEEVSQAHSDQVPVTWGLNLYGQGLFARNPHYGSPGGAFPLTDVTPGSALEETLKEHRERLWREYAELGDVVDVARLCGVLELVIRAVSKSGAEVMPLIRGIATSFSARALTGPDLMGPLNIYGACLLALGRTEGWQGQETSVGELLRDWLVVSQRTRQRLAAQLERNRHALLNPRGAGLAELHFLPLRVVKCLGWIGTELLVRKFLGSVLEDDEIQNIATFCDLLEDKYATSQVAVGDELTPFVYAYVRAAQLYGWEEQASRFLIRMWKSILGVRGAVSRVWLTPAEVFRYTLARAVGKPDTDPTLLARPSALVPTLMLLAEELGTRDEIDYDLSRLDHLSCNFFVPRSYSDFSAARIREGQNITFQIGEGVWTLADVKNLYSEQAVPRIREARADLSPETLASGLIAATLQPDRTALFLDGSSRSVVQAPEISSPL
jgi:hypothetical protein